MKWQFAEDRIWALSSNLTRQSPPSSSAVRKGYRRLTRRTAKRTYANIDGSTAASDSLDVLLTWDWSREHTHPGGLRPGGCPLRIRAVVEGPRDAGVRLRADEFPDRPPSLATHQPHNCPTWRRRCHTRLSFQPHRTSPLLPTTKLNHQPIHPSIPSTKSCLPEI